VASLDETTGLTAAERTMRASLAANISWANTDDREARTRKAREAQFTKYEKKVDPEGELTPEERHRRAESLRRAHMTRMALASAKARRLRREGGTA
jgi:hypothetical protein